MKPQGERYDDRGGLFIDKTDQPPAAKLLDGDNPVERARALSV